MEKLFQMLLTKKENYKYAIIQINHDIATANRLGYSFEVYKLHEDKKHIDRSLEFIEELLIEAQKHLSS